MWGWIAAGAMALFAANEYDKNKAERDRINARVNCLKEKLEELDKSRNDLRLVLENGNSNIAHFVDAFETNLKSTWVAFLAAEVYLNPEHKQQINQYLTEGNDEVDKIRRFLIDDQFEKTFAKNILEFESKMGHIIEPEDYLDYVREMDVLAETIIASRVRFFSIHEDNRKFEPEITALIKSWQTKRGIYLAMARTDMNQTTQMSLNKPVESKSWWSFLNCEREPKNLTEYEIAYKKERLRLKKEGKDITKLNEFFVKFKTEKYNSNAK